MVEDKTNSVSQRSRTRQPHNVASRDLPTKKLERKVVSVLCGRILDEAIQQSGPGASEEKILANFDAVLGNVLDRMLGPETQSGSASVMGIEATLADFSWPNVRYRVLMEFVWKNTIKIALEKSKGSIAQASILLGISGNTVKSHLRRIDQVSRNSSGNEIIPGTEPIKDIIASMLDSGLYYRSIIQEIQFSFLKNRLKHYGWNLNKAAISLGLSTDVLQTMMREHEISRPSPAKSGEEETK